MYLPAHFAVTDRAQLHGLMAAHPLATVVMQDGDGLSANHLPLVLDGKAGEWGVLRGHVARGNPLAAADGSPVLVIFHGPQTYVSPGDYATKAVDGRVVPTWNYAVVHAHGVLRTYPDAEWIRAQVGALTSEHEAGRAYPWAVSDAPADYTDRLLRAICGIEIVIDRLEGKWKVSQNQPAVNRESLAAALEGRQPEMAGLVRRGRE
ncbi:MAG: FMN-binding negative transcriptional regulator [Azonexus sp.]|jgi:transcriptional regulator|nr:FMN-binding negative transcriptional regulator [Betaproteobacteria bacterium]MBK8919545.1 FMN-binding negative transcriptional regulator [Betaproteobacteria bacterium]MBP6036313.1 FMN-binding negative transcriptional regulator [Azonexus sp.]MBP6906823.1 FMN-binding negative transcriptional regulator [Azonexus sp.]